mmetsp:Transcript_10341/g.27451  ORF Transcript_10341/g.27451 Transcript_10341/m.27451 type:complete len:397 (+) Transcript_10341:77-1267(+)
MAAVRAVITVTFLSISQGVQILDASAADRVSLERSEKGVKREEWTPQASGEEIDADDEDVPSGAVVINATRGSIALKTWYGRMGNNIIQLVNAILFCQMEGLSTLVLPEAKEVLCHDKSKACRAFDILNLPKEIKITPRPDLKLDCNFLNMKSFFGRCLAVTKSLFRQTAAQHLRPLMSDNWRQACMEERARQDDAHDIRELTIHLRNGDARNFANRTQVSPYAMYASCSFFKKVLADHGFQSARVITQKDMSHPCISVLREHLGTKFAVQSGSLEEDSCAIINARHLAVGSWSTFSQVLELFNDRLETNFWPVPLKATNYTSTLHQIGWGPCNPVVEGNAVTYEYQIDGMQEGHVSMDDKTGVDYFSRMPLEKVTLRSVCDEESEAPFEGAVSLR